MRKKTILVTGVAGLLGSHLADAMLAEGHSVFGCDKQSGGDIDNVPKSAEFFQTELGDHGVNLKFTNVVDVVLHAAATAYDGLSLFSPHYVTKNVFSNTVALAAAAVENRVQRFVFCSSMARYGQQRVPFTED